MKTFAVALIAAASAEDKKVPPRHPLQRLAKLNSFAAEWCNDNLKPSQATHWIEKFDKNTARFERRFEICPFYDENQLPHGGPAPADRKRRATDLDCDENGICRYNKNEPLVGIKQITSGFRKWAQRYIADCKVQPGRQVNRAYKWFGILGNKYLANQA